MKKINKSSLLELEKIGFNLNEKGDTHLLIKGNSSVRFWLISNGNDYKKFSEELNFFSTTFFIANLYKKLIMFCKLIKVDKLFFKHVGISLNHNHKQYQGIELNSCLSIYSGTESSDRKITVKITSENNLTSYLKIASNSNVNKLFSNEKQALLKNVELSEKSFLAPKFLGSGRAEKYWFLQTGSPWHSKNFHFTSQKIVKYILEKYENSKSINVVNYIESKNLNPTNNCEIQEVIQAIKSKYINENIHVNHMHGDLTYWNLGFISDDLYIFDWEYAGVLPVLFDYIHYKFSLVKRNKLNEESCTHILNSMEGEFGVKNSEVYMSLYLLIMSSRYQVRDAIDTGWVDYELHQVIFEKLFQRED